MKLKLITATFCFFLAAACAQEPPVDDKTGIASPPRAIELSEGLTGQLTQGDITIEIEPAIVEHLRATGGGHLLGESASPSGGGIETLARLEGNAPTPNESYLAKQMQTTVAACMASMIHEVSNTAWWTGGVWDRPFDVLWYPSSWRANNQKFTFRSRSGGGPGPYATVTFSNARYDPQQSSINYGPKRIAQNVEVNNDAKTKVIRNDSDATVSVSYDESESLTNSFSTSVTKGMTLDISVDSTQTISGGYGGVSASVSMQEHFGVSKTSEETHEQSEEGTTEESISIEFDAAPGNYYLVTITKEHEVTYQDFEIDGVMDFDIDIYMPGRNGGRLDSHYPGDHVKVQGVSGFNQFVNGYDTDYPAMQGFLNSAYSRTTNGTNCVLDANRRQVHVSGTNQASLESNADYRVESLGGSLPDRLAHLPVEDADDVGQ